MLRTAGAHVPRPPSSQPRLTPRACLPPRSPSFLCRQDQVKAEILAYLKMMGEVYGESRGGCARMHCRCCRCSRWCIRCQFSHRRRRSRVQHAGVAIRAHAHRLQTSLG